MKAYRYLVCILLSLLPLAMFGQSLLGVPMVHHYSKMVFQGGSRTWDIKQDSRGVLYFANNEGLISFDGKYWKRYPLPNHTIIRSIYIDANDRIYVGGQGEFGYFEPDVHTGLQYHSLKSLLPKSVQPFADTWNTAALGAGVFFRTTQSIFEYRDGEIKAYPATVSWEFLGAADGRLFAQDLKNGLLEFVGGKWQARLPANLFTGQKISGIKALQKGHLLLSTINHGDYLLTGTTLTAIDATTNTGLYTPSLALLDAERYVVATASAGCVIRQVDGKPIQSIALAEGLQNKNVSTVFVDRQNNIWAGVDNGIAVISYGSAIRYFRPNLENDVTGYSTRVMGHKLYLSSSNGVYVTPLTEGVKKHSMLPNRFALLPGSDRGEAWRLEEINGQLLLAHNRGLFVVRDGYLEAIVDGTGSWLPLPLAAVYPVAYSLLGTYNGLDLLHFADGKFRRVASLKGQADSYRFLELDTQGDIWASHPYRGIYRLSLSADKRRYEARLFTDHDGLPSSFQNYVFKVQNTLLFATEKGVYTFDPATQRFVPSPRFRVFDGLPIKYIQDDAAGNLWFCSGKKVGVAQFEKQQGHYRLIYFPELAGHQTSGFENIYPFDRNNVYIGSEKGVIHIDFENYAIGQQKPSVLLSSVTISTQADSAIYTGYAGLAQDTSRSERDGREVELAANDNALLFKYTAPSYGIHEHLTYSCFLEGYDTTWSAWTSEHEKAYVNLPSGHYVFQVKAKNNLDQESAVLQYRFIIHPPWYQSVWAVFAYVLLFVISSYGLVRWQRQVWQKQQEQFNKKLAQLRYIHQLEIEKNEKEIVKLQNEKLENEVVSKTKELANASMQLMENSGALSKLRVELSKLDVSDEEANDLKRITSLLNDVEKNTSHWDQFASHFDELNDGFMHRLKAKHPSLSRNDLKVCAYLRLNFSTKQIAQLQNISVRGVEIHRYRIRKKLGIDTNVSTGDYLSTI